MSANNRPLLLFSLVFGLALGIDATLQLTKQIRAAAEAGAPEVNLLAARNYQRGAQFLTDFIEAENSMGFHADQEAMRILAKALNYARLGQAELSGVPLPPVDPTLEAPPQTVTPRAAPAPSP